MKFKLNINANIRSFRKCCKKKYLIEYSRNILDNDTSTSTNIQDFAKTEFSERTGFVLPLKSGLSVVETKVYHKDTPE